MRRFGAAAQHHIGIVILDQPGGIADGMRAGGAGRDHGMVRALVAEADRGIARDEIDQPPWNEEGRQPARALLFDQKRGFLDAGKPANAGADEHAGAAALVFGLRLPSRNR